MSKKDLDKVVELPFLQIKKTDYMLFYLKTLNIYYKTVVVQLVNLTQI